MTFIIIARHRSGDDITLTRRVGAPGNYLEYETEAEAKARVTALNAVARRNLTFAVVQVSDNGTCG